ncbi:MAG: hypothetical protein CM1200mP18_14650 [Gammaproteobacteria bacterium]|nr:MAG: hypothetical protein CM1200mP18_14650 [Gammaproteobacteria bacterium]
MSVWLHVGSAVRFPALKAWTARGDTREDRYDQDWPGSLCGGTGPARQKPQAAMVGYRNQHTRGHIITIEDPIEFVHDHIK